MCLIELFGSVFIKVISKAFFVIAPMAALVFENNIIDLVPYLGLHSHFIYSIFLFVVFLWIFCYYCCFLSFFFTYPPFSLSFYSHQSLFISFFFLALLFFSQVFVYFFIRGAYQRLIHRVTFYVLVKFILYRFVYVELY